MAFLGLGDSGLDTIVQDHAPSGQDYAQSGQIWVDETGGDVFIACGTSGGLQVWVGCGGGSGAFNAVTVNPGNLTVTAGNLAVTAGTVTFGAFGRGLVFSSAAGLLSAAAGTDGQIVIGATGASPLWASLASSDGSVGIAVGANTIDLTVTGATGSSFPTDGAVVTPLAGATSIVGDTNITTDGAVANTVTINLNPSVSVTGKLTAGNDLEMTTGTCLIASDDNAANAIYLHTTGGVNEQINIHADAGTGMQSVWMHSDVGGINLEAGVAAASAVLIEATDAAGGIGMTAGTGGVITAVTNGVFTVETGTGAVSIGADAVAHNCTFGGTTGAAATTIQAGTGNLVQTSTGTITLDATGVLELNSSAGAIGIGNDAVAQNINIGTGAAARTVTIGNSSGASSVVVDCGTGNADFGATATVHTSRLGSTTGASATTVQAGTGALAINGGGAVEIDSVGALDLNTSAGAINIATDAVAVVTTIGNVTGVSQVVVDCGTAGVSIGASATAHASIFGSTNTTSNTTVQSGSGALVLSGAGDITVDAVGTVEINSSAAAIRIGNDAVAQDITIGGGAAARTIGIGNDTGATSVIVTGGTGAMSFGANAIAHATTIGSTTGAAATTVQGGTGGIAINAAGLVSITAATDSQAGAAVTINANIGKATFTGLTTAAGASQDFTITNSLVTAASGIIYSIANKGANDAQMQVTRMVPGAGSFVLSVTNQGAADLNGDVIISFIVLG